MPSICEQYKQELITWMMKCQSESEYKVSYSVITTVTELTVISTDLPLDLSILGNLGLQREQRGSKAMSWFLIMLTLQTVSSFCLHMGTIKQKRLESAFEPRPSICYFTLLDGEFLATTHSYTRSMRDCRQWLYACPRRCMACNNTSSNLTFLLALYQ